MFKKLTYFHKNLIFVFSIIGAYIGIFFSEYPNPQTHVSICVIHNLTGYPCPACGTGRGLVYIRYGEFTNAFLMNPLSYISLIMSLIALIWIVFDLIKKKNTFLTTFNKKIHPSIIILIIIFTICNGIWNIYKGV